MISLISILDEIFKSDIQRGADRKRKTRSQSVVVKYSGLVPRTKTILFRAKDTGGSGTMYEVRVKIPSHAEISRQRKDITIKEKVELAIEAGDIMVSCSCPDFLYGGFRYMGSQIGYAINKERRFPKRNNPKLKGSVCKHTLGVLAEIQKHVTKIAKDFHKTRKTRTKIVRK